MEANPKMHDIKLLSLLKSTNSLGGIMLSLKEKYLKFLFLTVFFFSFLFLNGVNAATSENNTTKNLIQNKCAMCHKFEGKAESRFNLKAPDLMWGGSKFKRNWLVGYLMGKEGIVYQKGYRWDKSRTPAKHMTVNKKEAEAIADYFKKKLKDSRVKANTLDLAGFTEMEASLGKKIFKEHSCIACHQIKEDGKTIGGSQSTSLHDAGKRLNVDWVYRFNLDPPDFVPHSGEFVADVSELGLRYVTGYIMTLGVDGFKFYEPWKDEIF
jgi:mono/diheme cytochrome c family protein